VERKNSWHLAEAIGETGPHGVQRLLNGAVWDADAVRDDVRGYVIDHLGDAATGVLIVDDTGFVKKGEKSCGVARQYTGTVGDTVNAQVGVFLAYASRHGAAFIDRALYLPHAWTDDIARCREAGVPADTRFATKIVLAQHMLMRAAEADVPARWVLADAGYGRSHAFRRWLEAQGWSYALMVPKTHTVWYRGRRSTVAKLGGRLTAQDWTQAPSSSGPYNVQCQAWACLPLSEGCPPGRRRWLLVRRSADDPDELAYYVACGPEATATTDLVHCCGQRWQIEECFAQAKGEVGLDQYEVRTWAGWHRFVTLCLLAHAYLVVLRHAARLEEAGQKGDLKRT
jgi:SRSO17 transposase